jgi:hypothetical protein
MGVGLTFAACSDWKVKKPTSDSTAPKLVWNVFNHDTNEQADHTGSPTLNAKRGQRYRVTLKALDPEGVKSIQINPSLGSGEMAWQCQLPPDLGQNKTATLAPMNQDLTPDADGNVLNTIFLIFEMDLAMPCQSGWTFASGSAKLTGAAGNYFGGKTTDVLRFVVTP